MTGRCQCGAVLPPSRGGPPRKWCSELCRKRCSYGGVCVDCGAQTGGGNGPGKAAKRCAACWAVYQRAQAHWTPETVVEALREFAGRYGRAPAATDFNANMARALGHEERAERFYADGCYPEVTTVRKVFGTWNRALDAAGLPHNRPGRRRRVAA